MTLCGLHHGAYSTVTLLDGIASAVVCPLRGQTSPLRVVRVRFDGPPQRIGDAEDEIVGIVAEI
jgi:hypothetical protein